MTIIKAITYLENLALWFEQRAYDSQEDIEVHAYQANAKGARDIANLLKGFKNE